ncbi:MAG: Asp23/Gls24 family envelope stress response protein [Synergistaceae bacterium]|nr:Asp23/Gls24 family envelope stress response protein [Synergistaceae bacterium]
MEKGEGTIHISEDVIVEIARKTLTTIPGIILGGSSIASKLGIGKKMGDGLRISVDDGKVPSISVDTYISVKYGLRIPDIAWDVQEKVKEKLEAFTGYNVKAVNVNVQGIHFSDKIEKSSEKVEEAEHSTTPAHTEQ